LTIIGLDTHARGLNAASSETATYGIGGLPQSTTLTLAIWNGAANGENRIVGAVTTTTAGILRIEAPLHAAFVLTTVPVS
jgi:hypothetical protein